MGDLSIGDTIHGFTLISKTKLPEQNGVGLRFRHDATDMDIYQVANDDPENFFSFIFKTPPKNNSGTPHVIEHSVLSGSRKYRTKDPFLSLMKGSANTFLNAMTYPDKTVYPAASPIKKDYFNLLSVYADAVFFPLLRKETFKQEGIRLSMDPKGNLSYDGIVFNEMKGAYSDHDSIVAEHSTRSLFPDTAYGYDSGGDPQEIINLTYEEFKGFHAEFYHPTNCRLFLYGDIPIEEQLQFLQVNFLKDFTAVKLTHDVQEPKPWKKPVYHEFTTPLNAGEPAKGKSTITINWVACSIKDPLDVLTLELLTEALLGNPGAPLYKAIIESGLGSDISSISGMDSDFKDVVFSLGIRGTDPDKRDAFEHRMRKELTHLVQQGIPKEIIRQAVKRIEFQQREIRGGIPTGLRVMSRMVRGWLHGLAPEDTLLFEPVMKRLKTLITGSVDRRGFLENWIDEHLLKNPHRSVVVVRPDTKHASKVEEKLAKHLSVLQKKLTKKELRVIGEEQKQFLTFQQRKDKSEDLEKIPLLTREDLPLQISRLHVNTCSVNTITCYEQKIFTHGIVYIDLAFDLGDVDSQLLDLMPLFSRLIYMTGIPGFSYDLVSRMLAEKTGGFSSRLEVSSNPLQRHLVFRVKMLQEDVHEALDLIRKVLLTSELWDVKRIRDIILEQRSDFSTSIIPSGSAYAVLRAASKISNAAMQDDRWKGLGQWDLLNSIDETDDQILLDIASQLGKIRDMVLVRNRLVINLTCDEEAIACVRREVRLMTDELPLGDRVNSNDNREPLLPDVDAVQIGETFLIPSQVAYTALVCNADPFGTSEQTAQSILTHILKTNQFWEAIRVLGGAYGVSASIDLLEGTCQFTSYRDPRIVDTFADYQNALESISSGTLADELVELSVISLVGKDVRPMTPGEKSYIGFKRMLYGISDDIRERRREQLLSATRADVIRAAQLLLQYLDKQRSIVVLSSQEMYMKDRERLPKCLQEASILPL